MSFAGIEAGKAFVEFLIKDDKLDSGLLKVADKLKKFGSIGLAATLPILAAFGACAGVFASTGSALQDLHERTGLSVESLSELSFAAKQTGTDMGVVEKAIKELQKKGIATTEFDSIANDLAGITDETVQAQRAIDMFGSKAGIAILPMLRDLPQLRDEARQLGLVMSTEDAAAADELGDAWDAGKSQMMALAAAVGSAVAGPISDFLIFSQGIVVSVIEFTRANPGFVRCIALVTAAIAAASAASVVFGTILTILTVHPIVAGLTALATVLLGIATYFGLASDGADDFSKKLDGVNMPGDRTSNAPLAQQAADVQRQLQAASVGCGQFASPITPQAVQAVNRDSVGVLETLSKAQLETLQAILEVLKVQDISRGILWGGT